MQTGLFIRQKWLLEYILKKSLKIASAKINIKPDSLICHWQVRYKLRYKFRKDEISIYKPLMVKFWPIIRNWPRIWPRIDPEFYLEIDFEKLDTH